MGEAYRTVCISVLLGICTYTDIQKREISMKIIGIFAAFAMLWCIFYMEKPLWQQAGGVVIGVLLLVLSKLTKEAIGKGDGYLMMVTGMLLGLWDNVRLLLGALLIVAVFAVMLLVLKKADKKKELPFVPFLLMSYIGMLAI